MFRLFFTCFLQSVCKSPCWNSGRDNQGCWWKLLGGIGPSPGAVRIHGPDFLENVTTIKQHSHLNISPIIVYFTSLEVSLSWDFKSTFSISRKIQVPRGLTWCCLGWHMFLQSRRIRDNRTGHAGAQIEITCSVATRFCKSTRGLLQYPINSIRPPDSSIAVKLESEVAWAPFAYISNSHLRAEGPVSVRLC